MTQRNRRRHLWAVAFGLTIILPAAGAHAHTRWKLTGGKLHPRSDSTGLKTTPCGAVAATTNSASRTVLVAGDSITVQWEETVQHPGHFRIAFSPHLDSGFDQNVLKDNIVDDQNGNDVNSNDPATFHQFSTTITVPNVLCDDCTMQVIQCMTSDVNQATIGCSDYYSCADVRIVKDASEVPPPSTATSTGTTTATATATGTDGATKTDAGATSATKPAAPTGLKIDGATSTKETP